MTETQLNETTTVSARPGLVRRFRSKVAAGLIVGFAFVVATIAPAAATPSVDPTGGAGDTFFSGLTDYLQEHLIVAVLGLAVIGVIVAMILKWGGKAAKKS